MKAGEVLQVQPDIWTEPGDVVMVRLKRSPIAYALRVMPNPPQIVCGTFEDALARAKQFAEKARVDVWVAEGDHRWTLVACHRAAAQPS